MVGDNKILTVSYGTFSCTLEGFDDPFSTMKAIAEYFRDLAAEDRFFGAEPPQPDADMLHRIAEQTIQSRVNAEVTDNSLVLRQDHNASAAVAAAPLAAAAVAQPEPAPKPEAAPVAATPLDDNSIAAKLQRIRSVVAQEAQASESAAQFYNEDEHADAFATETPKAEDAPVEDTVDEEEEVTEAMTADESVSEPEVASVVVSEETDEEDIVAFSGAIEEGAEETAEVVADDVSDDVVSDTEIEGEDDDSFELDDDTIAGALEAIDEAEDQPEEDSAENIFEEATPRRRIVVQKISRADVEAAQQGDAETADASDLSEEAEAALMRELADVEADLEDATAETVEDVVAEAVAADEGVEQTPESSNEDVAETVETSDVEDAEISTDDAASDKEDARAERVARRSLLLQTEDAALNRLMDATRTRLSDDDEGAVRRASIAHLKAAVAATKADDSIAQAAAKEEERELDQYRSDLARVVRPVRSRAVDSSDGEARPSTLMLVSEQRIEAPEADHLAAAAEADVRPRRVATTGNLALEEQFEEDNELQTGTAESFTEFAQRYHALELPDLLEAAAAHYAYVEKTQEFTRPMLMRKISTVSEGETPSREEGLRCFGALLRDNKIIRSGNGKFTLSESSRFASEARNSAG